jgi:predicted phage terminase large subunit-like protein
MRGANPVSFSALYQCDPAPEDGVFYRPEELFEYDIGDLPERLTYYVVSDHAVSLKAHNDPSVLCPFGVCANGIAWVMPDIVWRRMDTMETVKEMVDIIRRRKPVFWYAEKGHISKAIGPFLKDRMQQEGVYCPVIEDQPVLDKIQRAQSGRAKSAQGRIRYPRFAPWWPKAKSEMLKFPNGRFDDFVDVISMIGMKIGSQAGPSRVLSKTRHEPGTFGFMLEQFRNQDRDDEARKERAGW